MLATDQFVVHRPGSPVEPMRHYDRDSLTTEDILRFARRSWRLWIVWLLVSLAIGAALAVLLPRNYTSYTTILLSAPPVTQVGGLEASDSRGYVDSQIQVLQSNEVVGRAIDQTRLTEDGELLQLGGGLRSQIGDYMRVQLSPLLGIRQSADGPNIRYKTMIRVKHALFVNKLGNSNAIEIGFTSKSPQLSARLANAIATSYIENQHELRQMVRAEEASALQSRLAELRDKAFATQAPQDSSSADTGSADEARMRFREQQSTTEVYRSLYNSLLQRPYTDSSASSMIHSARVITAAEPPLRHSWPPIFLVMTLAAIGGSVGAAAHALIREATDRQLRTVDDVRRSSGLHWVAAIPNIPHRRWKASGPSEPCLQAVYSMGSAELHSTLSRVAIGMHEAQNRHGGLVIGVVSPVAGSGSSSIAVQLARVIRETGQKTLLVDANWRKGAAGQPMLDAEPTRKLTGSFATVPGDPEGLDILVLRATAPISELNASLSVLTELKRLQDEYDCLVVDLHSIEQNGDLEAVINAISQIVLVLQARRTSLDQLDGILRIVPRDKIAAAILNKL